MAQREEEKQEEKEQKHAEENEMKIDHDFLLSFEEPDKKLEKLPRSSSHSLPYNRTKFHNSRPQFCATPRPPSEFTLQSRPMRIFTVQIPQGEPTKKRLRLALLVGLKKLIVFS